jgi:hypothetical protein
VYSLIFSPQSLQNKCSEIDADHKSLESKLAEALACCSTEEERQCLRQQLSPFLSQLADVKRGVESKAAAHASLTEHATACQEARDKILRIQASLLSEELSPETVSQLMADLQDAREQLKQLESNQDGVKAKLLEAGLTCVDQSTGQPVDIAQETQSLLSDIDNDDAKLKVCQRIVDLKNRMDNAGRNMNQMKHVYTDDVTKMGSTIQVRLPDAKSLICLTGVREDDDHGRQFEGRRCKGRLELFTFGWFPFRVVLLRECVHRELRINRRKCWSEQKQPDAVTFGRTVLLVISRCVSSQLEAADCVF